MKTLRSTFDVDSRGMHLPSPCVHGYEGMRECIYSLKLDSGRAATTHTLCALVLTLTLDCNISNQAATPLGTSAHATRPVHVPPLELGQKRPPFVCTQPKAKPKTFFPFLTVSQFIDFQKKDSDANSSSAKETTLSPALACAIPGASAAFATPAAALACTIPAASAATIPAPKTADEVRKLASLDVFMQTTKARSCEFHDMGRKRGRRQDRTFFWTSVCVHTHTHISTHICMRELKLTGHLHRHLRLDALQAWRLHQTMSPDSCSDDESPADDERPLGAWNQLLSAVGKVLPSMGVL
jgi:hypothetical protein